jgi:hypothetical protein
MTQDREIIRARVGLLELVGRLGNVSQAYKMTGHGRDSFHRFRELSDKRVNWSCRRSVAAS